MAPLTNPAAKITLFGTFGGGEEWNTGFWVDVEDGVIPSPEQCNDLAEDIFNLFAGVWLTSLDSFASIWTQPRGARVHFYPAGSSVATVTGENSAEVAAGTGTVQHPFQVGIVCSLRSAVATRSGRGRMYLPLNGAPLASSQGQISPTDATAIADAMQAFFNGVNALTLAGQPVQLIVASHATSQSYPVINLIVNTVCDIQRRRANQLTPVAAINRPVTP